VVEVGSKKGFEVQECLSASRKERTILSNFKGAIKMSLSNSNQMMQTVLGILFSPYFCTKSTHPDYQGRAWMSAGSIWCSHAVPTMDPP
jgi:hypothetical protein